MHEIQPYAWCGSGSRNGYFWKNDTCMIDTYTYVWVEELGGHIYRRTPLKESFPQYTLDTSLPGKKMVARNERKWGSSLWACCCGSPRVRSYCSSSSEPSSLEQKLVEEDGVHLSDQTKPGWKAMPYILGVSLSFRLFWSIKTWSSVWIWS